MGTHPHARTVMDHLQRAHVHRDAPLTVRQRVDVTRSVEAPVRVQLEEVAGVCSESGDGPRLCRRSSVVAARRVRSRCVSSRRRRQRSRGPPPRTRQRVQCERPPPVRHVRVECPQQRLTAADRRDRVRQADSAGQPPEPVGRGCARPASLRSTSPCFREHRSTLDQRGRYVPLVADLVRGDGYCTSPASFGFIR